LAGRGTITLGDMRAKGMTMLAMSCDRCGRQGRLRIARLISEHGADVHGDLRRLIAHDCPRMLDPEILLGCVIVSGTLG
jgi:hypothetical protein